MGMQSHGRSGGVPADARRGTRWRALLVAGLGAVALCAGTAGTAQARRPVWSGLASPPAWAAGKGVRFFAAPHAARGLSTSCAQPCPTLPLIYRGGPVQHHPHVHLIFWGANWNGAGAAAKQEAITFYQRLTGSPWQGILLRYFDGAGGVGADVTVDSYVDTTLPAAVGVTRATLGNEIATAVAANGWSVEPDAQFVVLPAPGSTYDPSFGSNFCGFHDERSPSPATRPSPIAWATTHRGSRVTH